MEVTPTLTSSKLLLLIVTVLLSPTEIPLSPILAKLTFSTNEILPEKSRASPLISEKKESLIDPLEKSESNASDEVFFICTELNSKLDSTTLIASSAITFSIKIFSRLTSDL